MASPRADDCRAIAGRYENVGEGAQGGRGEALFELLVAVYDHEKPRRSGDNAPGVVVISMPEPGVLEARTQSLSQRFRAGHWEFACAQGALEFSRVSGTDGNVGAWFGSSLVRVAKTDEGGLVASREEAGFALLGFVVPIYMSFLNWSRCKAVGDAPQRSSGGAQASGFGPKR